MPDQPDLKYSRRAFLKVLGGTAAGVYVAAVVPGKLLHSKGEMAIAASEAYLLVDTKKCQGCTTCMLACSLAHEGVASHSLSRIQIMQNSFAKWPDDISIAQCRQCTDPLCMKACSTGALYVDPTKGNVRTVDDRKCIGCMQCIQACPFTPSRMRWDFKAKHALKCDLCADTPFWNQQGGPDGKQACVELCPVGALKCTKTIPEQKGDKGYNVNLRKQGWKNLGFTIDSEFVSSDEVTAYRPPYAGRYERPSDPNREEIDEKQVKE